MKSKNSFGGFMKGLMFGFNGKKQKNTGKIEENKNENFDDDFEDVSAEAHKLQGKDQQVGQL